METTPSRLADAEFLAVLAEAQERHDHAAKLFLGFATQHLKSAVSIQRQIDEERVLLGRGRLNYF